MKFSILVSAHPSLPAAKAAIHFCNAVLRQNFTLHKVFFLGEGVLNSSPKHATQIEWEAIGASKNVELLCCIKSAQQYKLTGSVKTDAAIHTAFSYAGLGQLIEASERADRVITFGQAMK